MKNGIVVMIFASNAIAINFTFCKLRIMKKCNPYITANLISISFLTNLYVIHKHTNIKIELNCVLMGLVYGKNVLISVFNEKKLINSLKSRRLGLKIIKSGATNATGLAENISEKNAYKIKNNKDGKINFAIILTEIALKPKTFPKRDTARSAIIGAK